MSAMFWAIIAGVFFLLELVLPGLVTIWFGLAGIVMIFLAPLIDNRDTEFYIFAALSLFFLIITRPIAKKYLYKKEKDVISFGNRTIGRETKVIKLLDDGVYEVILDDKAWRGISDETLELNDKVKIIQITGNKLVLEKKVK